MTFPDTTQFLETEPVSKEEIANLAFKFYVDGNCQEGHDHEHWLCAEYMLAQKKMIENQINSIHQCEHSHAGN